MHYNMTSKLLRAKQAQGQQALIKVSYQAFRRDL